MKVRSKKIFKYSLVTACIFSLLVIMYTAIMGYMLTNEAENIDKSTGVFKDYGGMFEQKLNGFSGEERVIEEGKGIFIMMYSRQAHLATELLVVMFVGMVVGAGIGYVNETDDISKKNVKKMFVIYGIGVITIILICYLYMNISNITEPEDVLPAMISASLPVLLYSLIYILTILYKIIKNKKKKDSLNELLKESKLK